MDLTNGAANQGETDLRKTKHRKPGVVMDAGLALAATTLGVSAREFTIDDPAVDHPLSCRTPSMAPVGVAYPTIADNGSRPDCLAGGSSDVSEESEVCFAVRGPGARAPTANDHGGNAP